MTTTELLQPTESTVPASLVVRAIRRRSFANLATTSPAGRPHVAGVLYQAVVDGDSGLPVLYASTLESSRKAINVATNPAVAMAIPVRRLPVGPPAEVHFQGRAEVLTNDDPEVRRLAAGGRLTAVTSHGELDLPGGCFLRITPGRRLHTYGLGMSLWRLLRDPLSAGGLAVLG